MDKDSNQPTMPLGPVMVDISGTALTPSEIDMLQHPLVGGVILFSRNYQTKQQVTNLVAAMRACRSGQLLIAVDHEGGRVQRFQTEFTALPAMRLLGQCYEQCSEEALTIAQGIGLIMAYELRACDIDMTFAPVLDIDRGWSTVIGDRSFHHDGEIVAALAIALCAGLHHGGMVACGKHFPGHGGVAEDSHMDKPSDKRPRVMLDEDLLPFKRLIASGMQSIMTAHIAYPCIDDALVCFSTVWLQQILCKELGFSGTIISDDLNMGAATATIATPEQRVKAALQAGCHMVLLCNDQEAARASLAKLETSQLDYDAEVVVDKLTALKAQSSAAIDWPALQASSAWQAAQAWIQQQST